MPRSIFISASITLFALTAVPLLVADFFRLSERSRGFWLSAAGGIGVAYVFVDLLPELGAYQKVLEVGGVFRFEGKASALALLGILVFGGVQQWVVRHHEAPAGGESEETLPLAVYGFDSVLFAVYSGLIGYLVMERFHEGEGAVLFLIAMTMHVLVSDAGLHRQRPRFYKRRTRWLLAGFTATGVVLGAFQALSGWSIAILSSLLAGGIIMNTLREEVPGLEQRRYWVFALATVTYATILLVA